ELALARRPAGHERAHPRAAALALARKEIDVETAELPVAVGDPITAHRRMPDRRALAGLHLHAVEPLDHAEEPAEHAIDREVRAQLLVVEVEAGLAQLLGVVADVPGLHLGRALPLELAPERDQLGVLLLEERARSLGQIAHERLRVLPALGHALLEHEVREVA